jgi:hypothetical protein
MQKPMTLMGRFTLSPSAKGEQDLGEGGDGSAPRIEGESRAEEAVVMPIDRKDGIFQFVMF